MISFVEDNIVFPQLLKTVSIPVIAGLEAFWNSVGLLPAGLDEEAVCQLPGWWCVCVCVCAHVCICVQPPQGS